jgi:hypothetical protein
MASAVSLVDLQIRRKQLTLINTKLIQIKFKKRKVNLIHNRKNHTHVLATQPSDSEARTCEEQSSTQYDP